MTLLVRNKLNEKGLNIALKQLFLSTIVVVFCCFITYIRWGADFSLSALLGGLVVIVPNIVFAIKTFRYSGARSAEKVIQSFYSGEKLKMVLTIVFVAVSFKLVAVEMVPFFVSFSLVVAVPLLTPFLFKL